VEKLKPEESPEELNMILLHHNYNMMNGEMRKLLLGESIGGNAGRVEINGEKYSCAGANCYIDPETGEIIAFGNFQDVSPDILDRSVEVTFRVAVDFRGEFSRFHGGFFKIVETYGLQGLNPVARRMVEESVEEYNRSDIKMVKKMA